jgi:hypothetical protein
MKSFTERVIPRMAVFVILMMVGVYVFRGCAKRVLRYRQSCHGIVIRTQTVVHTSHRRSTRCFHILTEERSGELSQFEFGSVEKMQNSVFIGDSVSKDAESYYLSFFQNQNGVFVFKDSFDF